MWRHVGPGRLRSTLRLRRRRGRLSRKLLKRLEAGERRHQVSRQNLTIPDYCTQPSTRRSVKISPCVNPRRGRNVRVRKSARSIRSRPPQSETHTAGSRAFLAHPMPLLAVPLPRQVTYFEKPLVCPKFLPQSISNLTETNDNSMVFTLYLNIGDCFALPRSVLYLARPRTACGPLNLSASQRLATRVKHSRQ